MMLWYPGDIIPDGVWLSGVLLILIILALILPGSSIRIESDFWFTPYIIGREVFLFLLYLRFFAFSLKLIVLF